MRDEKQGRSATRREFLRGAAMAGGAGAVLVSAPATVLAQGDEVDPDEPSATGYRLTAHILEYYKTAAS